MKKAIPIILSILLATSCEYDTFELKSRIEYFIQGSNGIYIGFDDRQHLSVFRTDIWEDIPHPEDVETDKDSLSVPTNYPNVFRFEAKLGKENNCILFAFKESFEEERPRANHILHERAWPTYLSRILPYDQAYIIRSVQEPEAYAAFYVIYAAKYGKPRPFFLRLER